jgi:hypothetical protein
LVVALRCAAAAAAAEDAVTPVLDRALKAMGGNDRLARLTAVSFNTKGTFDEDGLQVGLSGELSFEGLGRPVPPPLPAGRRRSGPRTVAAGRGLPTSAPAWSPWVKR